MLIIAPAARTNMPEFAFNFFVNAGAAMRTLLVLVTLCAASSRAQEITVQTIDADSRVLAEKFMKENPGTKVNFRLVSYQSILESLPVQLASGRGPDISMVGDWGGLAKY